MFGMIMLINFDTLVTARKQSLMDSVLQEMYAIITVTKTENNVASISSFIISRSDRCSFTQPVNQLQIRINEMASSVMTARKSVVCS